MRGHSPRVIENFRGLYTRGDHDQPPEGYFSVCDEMMFQPSGSNYVPATAVTGMRPRPPRWTFGNWPNNVVPVRFFFFPKSTGGRYICMDSNGNFYDTAVGAVPFLTIAGAVDFSGVTLFDRFWFCPHDLENSGKSGSFVYVYDPTLSSTARKICGTKPASLTGAISGTAGVIEPGWHTFAVAFETNTGFVTKPGGHFALNMPAARKRVDFSAIPVGPAGTVARHILMSMRIPSYDGNALGYKLFFAAKINDNVTTVGNVDLYDTQLVADADYLQDNLEEVPAGLCLGVHEGRLLVGGAPPDTTLVRVSKGGDPETFSAVSGFIRVLPGNGGPVRNIKSARGNLYFWKRYRTAVTRDDGENTPNKWQVDVVDSALGSEVFGVSETLGDDPTDGLIQGGFIVCNRIGAWFFDGSYAARPLSYVIEPTWKVKKYFYNRLFCAVDPLGKRILIGGFSHDSGGTPEADTLLVCDYNDGLTWDAVKWSDWSREVLLSVNGWTKFVQVHVAISTGFAVYITLQHDSILKWAINPEDWDIQRPTMGVLGPQATMRISSPDGSEFHYIGVRCVFSRVNGTKTNVNGIIVPSGDDVVQDAPMNVIKHYATATMGAGTITADPVAPVFFGLQKMIMFEKPWSTERAK